MEQKKPNGGYSRLKIKFAELQEENKRLAEEVKKSAAAYDEQFKKINAAQKEVIETRAAKEGWRRKYADQLDEVADLKNRIDYLLGCIPFWVKWAYNRKFGN